jgi:hypothetical protein
MGLRKASNDGGRNHPVPKQADNEIKESNRKKGLTRKYRELIAWISLVPYIKFLRIKKCLFLPFFELIETLNMSYMGYQPK